MQHYDFRCEKCYAEFPLWMERGVRVDEVVRSDEVSDLDEELIDGLCPKCGHDEFRRIYSPHPVHSSWMV